MGGSGYPSRSTTRDARAWSCRGASLGDRLRLLLETLAESPAGTVFNAETRRAELRIRPSRHDVAAVYRATLTAPGRATSTWLLSRLELVGDDLRLVP